MPTYTKETALYDTGAIKDGIDDAGTKADNYLTDVSGGGVMVHPSDDSTSGWKISSALELLKSGVSYIWAGLVNNIATVRVGKETGGHSVIDENGMRIYGGSNGAKQLANIGYGSGQGESGTAIAPYYSLGDRATDGAEVATSYAPGNYSLASGNLNIAQGYASHAEGMGSEAIGSASHAEGHVSIAVNNYSHAEGQHSIAAGYAAHAEGYYTRTRSDYAHAQNRGTIAKWRSQTAMGEYNEEDPATAVGRGTYALIIGNGDSDTGRSNALTVDWDGNLTIPKSKYVRLDMETNKSRIRSNAYNNAQNIYYCTEGYHSFYCGATGVDESDGTGVVYIGSNYAQFNQPITSGSNTKKLLARSTVSKDNQTIAGSGTKYGTITIDASKSGYTPIGLIGYDISNASSSGANASYISVYEARLSGSNVSVSVRNNHASAAAKIKVAATVLYTSSTQGIDSI